MFNVFLNTSLDDNCLCGILYPRSIPPFQWVFDSDVHFFLHLSYQKAGEGGMLFFDFVKEGKNSLPSFPSPRPD